LLEDAADQERQELGLAIGFRLQENVLEVSADGIGGDMKRIAGFCQCLAVEEEHDQDRRAEEIAGGVQASGRQCQAVLNAALESCERYYQAFQFVMWAGKSAREALDSIMFETLGEA